ncbi:MAG: hypothetical protein ACFCUH_05575 [Flavobacteriales bacterium]
MKLRSILFGCFLFLAFGGWSQNQFAFGVDGGTVAPNGSSFSDSLRIGYSLSFRAEVLKRLWTGATYSRYSRTDDGARSSLNPITGFAEYRFFDKRITPTARVDAGFYIRRTVADNEVSDANLDFGFAAGAGVLYKVSDGLVVSALAMQHYLYRNDALLPMLAFSIGVRTAF